MDIELDPEIDRLSRHKHGVALVEAEDFDWDNALAVEDRTELYDEQRFRALGFLRGDLHMLVFTLRNESTVRVISLRKATRAEWRRWSQG